MRGLALVVLTVVVSACADGKLRFHPGTFEEFIYSMLEGTAKQQQDVDPVTGKSRRPRS